MSLSPSKLAYQAILSASDSFVALVTTKDTAYSPITDPSNNILDEVLPSDETIQEIISLVE